MVSVLKSLNFSSVHDNRDSFNILQQEMNEYYLFASKMCDKNIILLSRKQIEKYPNNFFHKEINNRYTKHENEETIPVKIILDISPVLLSAVECFFKNGKWPRSKIPENQKIYNMTNDIVNIEDFDSITKFFNLPNDEDDYVIDENNRFLLVNNGDNFIDCDINNFDRPNTPSIEI